MNSLLTKAFKKNFLFNHLYQTNKSPVNLISTILALHFSNYQLSTYIVTLIEMPSNDFQYQGLENWVHLKNVKKKIKVVTLPSKQKQNKSCKTTAIIQGEQFYTINSTLYNVTIPGRNEKWIRKKLVASQSIQVQNHTHALEK